MVTDIDQYMHKFQNKGVSKVFRYILYPGKSRLRFFKVMKGYKIIFKLKLQTKVMQVIVKI